MKALSVFLLTTTALTVFEAQAGASPARLPSVHRGSLVPQVASDLEPDSVTLYDQTSSDAGIAVISDGFDSDGAFSSYDSAAADDFAVPSGHVWKIREIDAPGAYTNGSGPSDYENVYLYKDKHGLPSGFPAAYCEHLPPISDSTFILKITKPECSGFRLKPGRYWLSVFAGTNFVGGGGIWNWENQTTREAKAAVWENPGNGFGTGCTSWAQENVCMPEGEGDHMFALKGRDIITN